MSPYMFYSFTIPEYTEVTLMPIMKYTSNTKTLEAKSSSNICNPLLCTLAPAAEHECLRTGLASAPGSLLSQKVSNIDSKPEPVFLSHCNLQ